MIRKKAIYAPIKTIIRQANKEVIMDLDNFDESQREAITSPEDNVVIRAPAGSGKTTCAIEAIVNYRYNYINDKICAITYTRAAKAEMEQRLKQHGVYDVDVATIHAWSRSYIYEFATKHGETVRLLDEFDIAEILQNLCDEYLKYSNVHFINQYALRRYINEHKVDEKDERNKKTYEAIESRYVQYKREKGLYDFTDLPQYLYDLMVKYDEYITDINALFVDEFQDVDPIQIEVFKRVINTRKKFYIGDKWQSIYQFRSADGKAFDKLDGFTQYKLKYNYRSYQEIINYATTVYESTAPVINELVESEHHRDTPYIAKVLFSYPSSITCERGYGGKITVINPFNMVYRVCNEEESKTRCGEKMAYNIFKQYLADHPNVMILCRTNKQVNEIRKKTNLTADTIHQAKGLEYGDVLVIDSPITTSEDLNIAYVALTRAKNSLLVAPWEKMLAYITERNNNEILKQAFGGIE